MAPRRTCLALLGFLLLLSPVLARSKTRTPASKGAPARPILIHSTRLTHDQIQAALSPGATRPVSLRPYTVQVGTERREVIRIDGGNSLAFVAVRLWAQDPGIQLSLLDGEVFTRPTQDPGSSKRQEVLILKLTQFALVRGLSGYGGTGGGPGAPGLEGASYPGNEDGGRWVYDCDDCPPEPVWGKDCRDEELDKREAYDALLEVEVRIQALQAVLQEIKDMGITIQIAKLVLNLASTAVGLATAGTGTPLAIAASKVIVELAANQALEALLGDLLGPEVVAQGISEARLNLAIANLAPERTSAQADYDAAKAAWQACMAEPGPHMTTAEIVAATRAQEAHDNCEYQQEFHGIGCRWVYVLP